jgi:predicted transcriptional regulator
MHDQPNLSPDQIDAAILGLLLEPDAQRPWSVEEVASEIGERIEVIDSLARLAGVGLVHRLDRFAWATRAALRGDGLAATA